MELLILCPDGGWVTEIRKLSLANSVLLRKVSSDAIGNQPLNSRKIHSNKYNIVRPKKPAYADAVRDEWQAAFRSKKSDDGFPSKLALMYGTDGKERIGWSNKGHPSYQPPGEVVNESPVTSETMASSTSRACSALAFCSTASFSFFQGGG